MKLNFSFRTQNAGSTQAARRQHAGGTQLKRRQNAGSTHAEINKPATVIIIYGFMA